MTSFTAKCPKCGSGFEADTDWIGQEGECPSCGAVITVAGIAKTETSKQTEAECLPCEDALFTFICPECGMKSNTKRSMVGQEIECLGCMEKVVVSIPEFQTCPNCKGQIRIGAKICKHCKTLIAEHVDMLPGEKACPHCGKAIKKNAIFCKYCKCSIDVDGKRHMHKDSQTYIIAAILAVTVSVCVFGARTGCATTPSNTASTYENELKRLYEKVPKEQVDIVVNGTSNFDEGMNAWLNLQQSGQMSKVLELQSKGAFGKEAAAAINEK